MIKSLSRHSPIDQQILEHLAREIKNRFGLLFENKLGELERILLRYLRKQGITNPDEWLLNGAESRLFNSPKFIEMLTVPETYFFRNPKLFDVLAATILPELIRQKSLQGQSLNIWSAGCSSGEEAYSIAMLIDQQPYSTQTRILATDVNIKALQKARTGIYSNWSFRKIPKKFLSRYFSPIDNRHFKLNDKIKQMVDFVPHNLKTGPFPVNNSYSKFDLILCRNVLIYFDLQSKVEVLNHFYDLLEERGYLITGPAEIPTLTFTKFKAQILSDVILYGKKQPSSLNKHLQTNKNSSPPQKKKRIILRPDSTQYFKSQKAFTKSPTQETSLPNKAKIDQLKIIRNHANQGNLKKALQLVHEFLKHNSVNPEAYYLLGTINLELSKTAEAEKWLQKVLFLNPDHILAHFHLAILYHTNGHHKKSKIYFKNVLKLIESYQPDAEIPETDGLSVTQFKQMIEKILPVSVSVA